MSDIIIIEDDPEMGGLVRDFLAKEGFSVRLCAAAETALELLSEEEFGLVLLDVMLPGMNGFETCAAIREKRSLPIIMMSALTDEDSKLTGYENGADDYIDKPFSIKVLTAKIRSLMRRHGETRPKDVLESCGITLDASARRVTKKGREILLNAKEFELLRFMMEHRGEALTRDALFNTVWGIDCFTEPATVSVHIRWLREKLEDDPNSPKLIQTVRKLGYRFGDGK